GTPQQLTQCIIPARAEVLQAEALTVSGGFQPCCPELWNEEGREICRGNGPDLQVRSLQATCLPGSEALTSTIRKYTSRILQGVHESARPSPRSGRRCSSPG